MRLLLVEDAADLGDAIVRRLRKLGYAIDWAADGSEADDLLRGERYNLVILDLMLSGLDGRSVLCNLRRRREPTPVLVLMAWSAMDDRVSLLDLGADDYIVKPFDFRELEARCRALLRRPLGMVASVTRYGNLTFDGAAKRVTVEERALDLGPREFRLLELFLGNLDRVLSKDALIDKLFGFDEAVAPNAIELYVSRLRRKLEGASVEIRTVRGLGYVAEDIATTLRIDTSHLERGQGLLYTFEARFAIEPLAAALAAERRREGDLAAMQGALNRLRAAVGSHTGGPEAEADFHRAVAEATGNPYVIGLTRFMHGTMVAAMRVSQANTARVTSGPANNVWQEHELIYGAIERQDAEAARKTARDHLRKSATRLSINRPFARTMRDLGLARIGRAAP